MANYNILKTAIQNAIKANGNNAITGPVLQSELISMVNVLGAGYQYFGVAQPSTNPGNPDSKCFFVAYTPGTYVNFDGIVVTGLCILKYDTVWRKEDINIAGGGGSVVTFNSLSNGTTQILVDGVPQAVIPSEYTLIKLSAFTTTSSGLANGAFYYNTSDKKIYQKRDPSVAVIPYYDGAIYTYNNELYVWDGTGLVNVSNGGGGGADFLTEPDDLTLQTVGDTKLLKFANRQYNSLTPNGLGFKILRGDSAFAQQVTEANTIYEIRYDFNLQAGTVNVPENCVLRFNGGSIRNGTLNLAENVIIEAPAVKIFNSVSFTGKTDGQYFFIDWFVANYAETIDASEPDATAEIQAMFNSGIKKVWLTNRHNYKITNTITIDASILVDGTRQTEQYRRENKMFFGNFDAPLFSIKPSSITYGASIKNIYIRRIVTDGTLNQSNDYKKAIPTILVDLSVAPIWGLYINAVIHQNRTTASYLNGSGSLVSTANGVGFTGIEIDAQHYCYYVRIEGEICDFYRGVYAHQSSSGLFTGAEYYFDSECAIGGELVGNAKIGGMHELIKVFRGGNNIGYFTTNSDVFIDGYIWDTSYTLSTNVNDLFAVTYSVKAKHFKSGPGRQEDIAQYDDGCEEIKNNYITRLEGNAQMASNILPQAFYGQRIGGNNPGGIGSIVFRAFETNADYQAYIGGDTTKGIPVDKENTFGFENLFFPDKFYYDDVIGMPLLNNYAMKSYIKDKAIKVLYFECTTSYLRRATLVVFQYSSIISSIVVNRSGTDYTFTRNLGYFAPIFMSLRDGGSEKISVTINYTTATEKADIPFIGICGPVAASLIGPWGGSAYGDTRFNKITVVGGSFESPYRKFITDPILREYKTNTSGSYVPVLHYKVSGYTVQTEIVMSINGNRIFLCTVESTNIIYGGVMPSGMDFQIYKKSSTDYIICAKNFKNLHVESVESPNNSTAIVDDLATVDLSTYSLQSLYYAIMKSGPTTERPSVPSGFVGTCYFDTTLGKPIWWKSSNVWVDATGATV